MRPLLAAVLVLCAGAAAAGPTLEPPPGWADASASGKVKGAEIVLKGPETSSFIVRRAASAPLDNPAGTRGFLRDVLAGMRASMKADYRSSGRVETRTFRNGLTAQLLTATLGGEPRLILALFSSGGVPHLAVLSSAAPEAMLPSLLGAVQTGRIEGAVQTSGAARSSDGQLEISLGGGLRARAPLDTEAAKGFVLVVQGGGSEVLFQKLSEAEATKPAEQAAIARELAAATANAPGKASPVRAAPTAAGPVGVYSWAASAGGEKYSVGYLPWGYWGYQLFGRGPAADELMLTTLSALRAGPAADARLLKSTPVIPIKNELSLRKYLLPLGAGCGLLGVILLVWSLRRKNANVGG